jgi:periodic tryptophan protein 1
MRSPTNAPLRWLFNRHIESIVWQYQDPTKYLISTGNAMVMAFDIRCNMTYESIFILNAHEKATCCIIFNFSISGFFATCRTDKKVKIWDTSTQFSKLLETKNFGIGVCFTLRFSSTFPFILAIGGAEGQVILWKVKTFAKKVND